MTDEIDLPKSEQRRQFVKTCLATATLAAANPSLIAYAEPLKRYQRVLLTDGDGSPINSENLMENQAFVFHYPYVTTPCFLLNLGQVLPAGQQLQTANDDGYTWQGGVGRGRSVVAFSAICTHKLSYPTRTLSFLNFRPGKTNFHSEALGNQERERLIYCCSERSAYDPAKGAEVLSGPASQPLTAIEIEYDAVADQFYVTGTRGGELYDAFFAKFGFRLALDHQLENVRAEAADTTKVYRHDVYSLRSQSC